MKRWIFSAVRAMYGLLFCGVLLLGIACRSKLHEGLAIYFFKDENLRNLVSSETAKAVYENDPSANNSVDLAKADLIITEQNILTYDWPSQKIVLSDDFREQYMSERFFFTFDAFIVSFKGEAVVSGGLAPSFAAAYYDTPVLFVDDPFIVEPDEEGLVMYLRPNSLGFGPGNEGESAFPIADDELAEEIREHLEISGK